MVYEEEVNHQIVQKDKYQGKVEIKETDSQEYLGEMIHISGSNKLNLQSKIAKSSGKKNDIIYILKNMYFGDSFLEVLTTLRNSLFLSVLLGNCEIWQNITKAEIKSIEAADHSLLTQCLGLSNKSSYCLI